MNINPLANQKRRYRALVTASVLASAIVVGWVLAQLLILALFSPTSPRQLSDQLLRLETDILTCTYVLPGPDYADLAALEHNKAQLIELEGRLHGTGILIHQVSLQQEVRVNLQRRCQLLQNRLNKRKLELNIETLNLELQQIERHSR